MTRLDTARELHERGLSQKEIAQELGLKSTRTVYRLLREAGVPAQPRRTLTSDERAQVKRLSEVEGWPPGEIAFTLNLPYDTVLRWTTPGPGKEWRDVAGWCAREHTALFRELRQGFNRATVGRTDNAA